ncbi:MAG: tetratricopeptide repeat protein [Pirellulaceae bacterium]|nr:tetratricopeptide repeat protein [Pirellulaceae bacterium]
MFGNPRRAAWAFGLILGILGTPAAHAIAKADAPKSLSDGTSSPEAEPLLDDYPEPLVPRTPRTEEDEDRLHALSHFSAGRALEQREEHARAIGHYQRAFRYDPSAVAVGWTIVALAEKLEWNDVRDRYFVLAARLDPDSLDPPDLLELADLVETEDDVRLVMRLFEQAVASRENETPTPLDVVLRWRLAEIHGAVGNHGKAAHHAALVLEALEHPENIEWDRAKFEEWFGGPHPPYWLFGDYFYSAGRWDEAEATFQKAHRFQPNAALLHFHLARIDFERKRPEAALEHIDACLRESSSELGSRPYSLLRTVLTQLGRGDELIERLETLTADDPDRIDAASLLARQYLDADRLDEAEKIFASLLDKRPDPRIHAALVKIHRKKDRLEPLLRLLGLVAGRDGSLDNLDGQLGALTSDAVLLDRLFAVARRRFADRPDALGPHAPLATALLAREAGRNDMAGSFFDTALRAAPEETSDMLLRWGACRMAQRRFAEAADVFRRGTETKRPEEDRIRFYYYLAAALEMDGQTDLAIEAARAASRLDEDSPLLAAREAWILYHAKRNDDARGAYARIVERFRDNHAGPTVRQVLREAKLVLSHLDLRRGDRRQAEEWLEEVLDEFPDDASAMNDLGYLWADAGVHLERALSMTRRAVEAEPDNAAYHDSLGWALYRSGRPREAVVVLQKAAEMLSDGDVLDHLGEVYLKLGESHRAAGVWREAAEAYRKAGQPDAAEAVEKRIADEIIESPPAPAMEKSK